MILGSPKSISDRLLEGIIAALLFRHPEYLSSDAKALADAAGEQYRAVVELREQAEAQAKESSQSLTDWSEKMKLDAQSTLDAETRKWREESGSWRQEWEEFRLELPRLKQAYTEKLRLSAAVQYWEDLESMYGRKGRIWVGAAASVVAVLIVLGMLVAYNPPAAFNPPVASNLPIGTKGGSYDATVYTLSSLKVALILATVISMVIYFIHLCAKLALSAYHLERDSRERLQLTHVFLALVKEGAIEPKDREIVLTALFARADTGLIKDSGPAIPTGIGALVEGLKSK